MTVRLGGSTSGYTELDAPAVAGNNTLVLPTGNGSAGNILGTDGAGNLSWVDRGRMVLETAKATTSGTAIDFTGIPSWVKRITVTVNGVSTNGTSLTQVQLGTSSGFETTNYFSYAASITGTAAAAASYTTGIVLGGNLATSTRVGVVTLTLNTTNTWCHTALTADASAGSMVFLTGIKALASGLTQIRLTTVNGTDTFDAGSVNILYEG